jgi:hypothetical protein
MTATPIAVAAERDRRTVAAFHPNRMRLQRCGKPGTPEANCDCAAAPSANRVGAHALRACFHPRTFAASTCETDDARLDVENYGHNLRS